MTLYAGFRFKCLLQCSIDITWPSLSKTLKTDSSHYVVIIKWKHFRVTVPLCRGIHRPSVVSLKRTGTWTFDFLLLLVSTNYEQTLDWPVIRDTKTFIARCRNHCFQSRGDISAYCDVSYGWYNCHNICIIIIYLAHQYREHSVILNYGTYIPCVIEIKFMSYASELCELAVGTIATDQQCICRINKYVGQEVLKDNAIFLWMIRMFAARDIFIMPTCTDKFND